MGGLKLRLPSQPLGLTDFGKAVKGLRFGDIAVIPLPKAARPGIPMTSGDTAQRIFPAPSTIPTGSARQSEGQPTALERFARSVRLFSRTVVLSPLTLIMGVQPDIGRVPWNGKRPPIGDGLKSLATYFESIRTDPAMAALYDMFLDQNWLVLTALASTRLGIPKTTTAMKISGGSFDGSHPLFTSIDHLLQEPAVQSDADFILRRGLASYYGISTVRAHMPPFVRMAVDVFFTPAKVPPPVTMPNPIQASQQFLTAATMMQALISQTSAAIATGQFIIGTKSQTFTHGSEIEVAAPDYNPDPPKNELRLDPMMNDLADELRGKGYKVVIETAEAHEATFTAKVMDPKNPGTMPYPFVYDYFTTADGRYFVSETYRGTGAYLITLKEINPTTQTVLSSETRHLQFIRDANGKLQTDAKGNYVPIKGVEDCRTSVLLQLGNKLGFEEPLADVNAAIASQQIATRTGFLLLVKGIDGDILKIKVDVDYRTKMASLTTLNGRFIISGLDSIYLPNLVRNSENPVAQVMDLVTTELRLRISGKRFAEKHDRIKLMTISRPESDGKSITLQIINEAHPFAELVSGIMTPDVIDIWQGAVEAMTELGWKGTVDDRLIGRHVHVGVAGKTPGGQWTLRPLVNLTRAIPDWISHFKELFPSNGNRVGFNQPQSDEVVEFFNSPHLDPENPDHILLTGLMIAGFNPQKYMGFNPDNIVSKVLRNMVGDGTFEMNSTRNVVWEGKTYKFSIKGMTRQETIAHMVSEGNAADKLDPKDIDKEQYHSYEIEGTLPDGRTMTLMRVPAVADKWTWEVRFPDTIMDGAHDTFLMKSFMAFMYKYGHAPLYKTPE